MKGTLLNLARRAVESSGGAPADVPQRVKLSRTERKQLQAMLQNQGMNRARAREIAYGTLQVEGNTR